MNGKLKLRAVVLTISLVLITAILLLWTLPHIVNRGTYYTAYIYKAGTLIQTIPLSEIKDVQQYIIGDPDSAYNTIEVIPDSICILHASCPDQICVQQGYISNSLFPITCLPNRLVIELKADKVTSDTTADAVTH